MGESSIKLRAALLAAAHKSKKKSSMYLPDTSGMTPRQIRDKVNGFRKD